MITEPSGLFVAAEEVVEMLLSTPEDQKSALDALLEMLAEVRPESLQ